MRVAWTIPAKHALREVGLNICKDNPAAAARVVARVRARVRELSVLPAVGRIGRVDRTRELVVTGTPYVVAYAVADREVHILAVKHAAQNWPEVLEGFGITYGG